MKYEDIHLEDKSRWNQFQKKWNEQNYQSALSTALYPVFLNKRLDDAEYYSKFARTKKERKGNEAVARFQKSTGVGKTLDDLKKFNAKKSSSAKKTTPVKRTTPAKKTTTSSFKSKVTKSRANLKSANKRVQQTTKKKATNTTKRTQSKFQKSFNNLKKNIKKLFGWR